MKDTSLAGKGFVVCGLHMAEDKSDIEIPHCRIAYLQEDVDSVLASKDADMQIMLTQKEKLAQLVRTKDAEINHLSAINSNLLKNIEKMEAEIEKLTHDLILAKDHLAQKDSEWEAKLQSTISIEKSWLNTKLKEQAEQIFRDLVDVGYNDVIANEIAFKKVDFERLKSKYLKGAKHND